MTTWALHSAASLSPVQSGGKIAQLHPGNLKLGKLEVSELQEAHPWNMKPRRIPS